MTGAAIAAGAKAIAGPAAKGAAGPVTKWTLDKIPLLGARYRNKEISFIENPETIASTKEVRKNAEFTRFRRFTTDPSKRVLLQLGIVMRSYAKNIERIAAERSRIVRRHGIPALHLVEAMQGGILSLIQDALEKCGLTEAMLHDEMEQVIENIDEYVAFVQNADKPDREAIIIAALIRASFPRVFAIAGKGNAVKITSKIAKEVSLSVSEYSMEEKGDSEQVAFVLRFKT